jgi:hypothetical protein
VLHPDQLTASAITSWLSGPDRLLPKAKDHMDFAGLTRLPVLLEEVLARPRKKAKTVKESV